MKRITSEDLAYWYFRLNGCFTFRNFVVHPEFGKNQKTDVDLIAIRFPYRRELPLNPMKDDKWFYRYENKITIYLIEAKASMCSINKSWTSSGNNTIELILSSIGHLKNENVIQASNALKKIGLYENSEFITQIICVGEYQDKVITEKFPSIRQLVWKDILEFIYNRFREFRNQKVSHDQWDDTGQMLYTLSIKNRTFQEFCADLDQQQILAVHISHFI